MLDNKKSDNDTATGDDLKPFLKNGAFPTCPSGGTYTINATMCDHPVRFMGQGTLLRLQSVRV